MTTPRSQIPVANLKERIAALEQRNAETAAAVQRATSPTPSATSVSNHSGPSNGALRDRIARFEKKGAVPVPRGRFGLGAPPVVEGPRKRGELYGNRIPIRTASGGILPLSRPASVTGSYDQRRSFSGSSVITDIDDDHPDHSSMSSPTFTLPDSPDSVTSMSSTPDISPSLSDFSNTKYVPRGTSFAQALEVARRAEAEKQERQNSTPLASWSPPPEPSSHVETPSGTAPTIVVSSEDVPLVITPEVTIVKAPSVPSTIPGDSPPQNVKLSHKHPSDTVMPNDASPAVAMHNPPVEPRIGTPPLVIRKRTPADLSNPSNVDKEPDTNENIELKPTAPEVLPILPPPDIVVLNEHNVEEMPHAINDPCENIEVEPSMPKVPPILPPPDIVVLNEQNVQETTYASIDSKVGIGSRDIGLTLDSEKLNDWSLMSPPLQPGHVPQRPVTVPAAKTIVPPESSLSPPMTGRQFGSPLSGSSSLSSLGRPLSMIETSPKFVTQLLRMTPATSRGVPLFVPPTRGTRKSDFVHFPPTPEDEATDLGSSTFSVPNRMRRGSDPEEMRSIPPKKSFSAVVHRKVREIPASATVPNNRLPLPQTPAKRATILDTPLSPGLGELAALLQEAVLLEDTLTKGELPSENPELEEEIREKEKKAKEAAAAKATARAKAKAEAEERYRLALATAQAQSKRDEPASGRLKHTFLVPLSKVRSQRNYTPQVETFSKVEKPLPIHPKSAGLPSQSSIKSFGTASATLPKMPDKQPSSDSTAQLPVKSPRFASLRKFGRISHAAVVDEVSARTKHSTSSEVSSEGSSSPATAENSLEFGHGTGSTLSFPLISPKKASKSLVRATSFAEKLFSRTRTKSGGSSLGSIDRSVDNSPVKTPVTTVIAIGPPPLDLPALPRPEIPPLSLEEKDDIAPLRRSASSKRSAIYFSPALDLTAVPQLPPIAPGFQFNPQTSSSSLLSVSNESPRPPSFANSLSSFGSLPSPLFNQELVDAFPSVPATTPTAATTNFSRKPAPSELNLATPTKASFDAALLSSAVHLSSLPKLPTPKASYSPLPSETELSTPHPSGEMVR